jgi:cytochrome P450
MTATTVPATTGPRGSRLLGLARALAHDPTGTYEAVMLANPVVGRIVVGPPGRRVTLNLVSHPDGVQEVLFGSGREHTKDTPFYREIAAWVGNGLLTSEGATWKRQRRTLAPLFTPRRIATYATAMAEEASTVAGRFVDAARAGEPVDLHAEMTEYTLRVVGRLLFGAKVDSAVPAIRTMFPVLNEYVRARAFSPLRLPRTWPTPRQRHAVRARNALYDVVDGIIAARRRDGDAADDLVSRLLAARDPETGEPLSPTEVRDQVLIFLLAGHETTSTALTFALHLLGHHPRIQDRARHEAVEALGGVPGGRAPTADDVARLPYTDMVVREAMRLYPPAFAVGRYTPRPATVAGHDLPAGSVVVVSPWATHRHPEFWPDPARFDPDRFLPDAVAARHKYAYLPFSAGPRNCIGNHFAMLEAVIALACLLRAVRLRTEPAKIKLATGITLRPAQPVLATVSVVDA